MCAVKCCLCLLAYQDSKNFHCQVFLLAQARARTSAVADNITQGKQLCVHVLITAAIIATTSTLSLIAGKRKSVATVFVSFTSLHFSSRVVLSCQGRENVKERRREMNVNVLAMCTCV